MAAELEQLAAELQRSRAARPEQADRGAADRGAEAQAVRSCPRRLRRWLIASDAVAIVIGASVALAVHASIEPGSHDSWVEVVVLLACIVPVWLAAMGANQLFRARAISRVGEEFRRLTMAGLMAVGLLVAVSLVAYESALSGASVMLLLVGVTSTLALSRLAARRTFAGLRRSGRLRRPVIVVGTGPDAVALRNAVERRPDLGYEIVGFTGSGSDGGDGLDVLGSVEETPAIVRAMGATGVILSVGSLDPADVNRLTRILSDDGCHVTLSSALHDIDLSRTRSQTLDGHLLVYVEPAKRSPTHLAAKRVFDVSVSLLVLVAAAPVMLLAALAIKLDSRGPVLFRQVRVGRQGEPFEILKFRSMCVDAESKQRELAALNERTGPLFKMTADPRVTRVGRFIRATSIDELPQLWNVIRGEMSLVGPRPALPAEAHEWAPELHRRLQVLPGITGMWQVSARGDADFEVYQRLDLYYVDNWSMAHDVKILLRTVAVVIAGRGAH